MKAMPALAGVLAQRFHLRLHELADIHIKPQEADLRIIIPDRHSCSCSRIAAISSLLLCGF